MKINDYKKIENKVNNANFHESYKGINLVMTLLSYFGHLASIFLAYFFVSGIIGGAISDNPIVVFVSTIVLLLGLESLKRDIFDKFSIQSLKNKKISKDVLPLLLISLLLISGSFYSSINGAKEFSSKEQEIEQTKEVKIDTYQDSLNTHYTNEIKNIEEDIQEYENKYDEKNEEQKEITSDLKNRGWISQARRERNEQLTEEKERLDNRIIKLENEAKNLKEEKESKINEYENELKEETEEKKEENTKNSFLFVIISTIIEFVILSGVYFSEYYKFRSYREERRRIESDPNYKKWLLYDEVIGIVINDETKINQKLPSIDNIIEMCRVNDVIILRKDVTDFLKILNNLNIIRSSGNVKYINKTKEGAQETLRRNFNIE